MNNVSENNATEQQIDLQVGETSQSLVRVHSKGLELSSTSRMVVNKEKYLSKQIATQELVKPNPRNSILMEGYKCLVCGSITFMHMHMIRCMREYNSFPKCEARQPRSMQRRRPSQLQICRANNIADMTIAPYTVMARNTSIPSMALQIRRTNLCCAHCNIEFENEQQVLQHRHIVKFKRKYEIMDNS